MDDTDERYEMVRIVDNDGGINFVRKIDLAAIRPYYLGGNVISYKCFVVLVGGQEILVDIAPDAAYELYFI